MTYLIVSEGVTAKTASIIPAPSPAKRLRGALTFPFEPQPAGEPINHDHEADDDNELTSLSASACLNLS